MNPIGGPNYENTHDIRALPRLLTQAKGALAVDGNTLTDTFKALSPPQFHRAAAGLCAELNALDVMDVTLPHAPLKLRYQMGRSRCTLRISGMQRRCPEV